MRQFEGRIKNGIALGELSGVGVAFTAWHWTAGAHGGASDLYVF